MKRINFFPDKNTLTLLFLPVFTVLHLNKPFVPRIAAIPLSCQYLFREGESWACSILFETQGKQNEIAVLQKAATVILTGRGENVAGMKGRNNADKSEETELFKIFLKNQFAGDSSCWLFELFFIKNMINSANSWFPSVFSVSNKPLYC